MKKPVPRSNLRPEAIYEKSEMVMKVKEPLAVEFPLIRKGQVLFTYFHFAASEELTRAIIDTGSIAVAYETVERANGSLPLLTPMSEVAGRMAIHEGAKYLEKTYNGKGILLGGVPGTEPGTVIVIGGGIVGTNAAKMACGMGARGVSSGHQPGTTPVSIGCHAKELFPAHVQPGHSAQTAQGGRSGCGCRLDSRRRGPQTDHP